MASRHEQWAADARGYNIAMVTVVACLDAIMSATLGWGGGFNIMAYNDPSWLYQRLICSLTAAYPTRRACYRSNQTG